jgi:hypothetical protein
MKYDSATARKMIGRANPKRLLHYLAHTGFFNCTRELRKWHDIEYGHPHPDFSDHFNTHSQIKEDFLIRGGR